MAEKNLALVLLGTAFLAVLVALPPAHAYIAATSFPPQVDSGSPSVPVPTAPSAASYAGQYNTGYLYGIGRYSYAPYVSPYWYSGFYNPYYTSYGLSYYPNYYYTFTYTSPAAYISYTQYGPYMSSGTVVYRKSDWYLGLMYSDYDPPAQLQNLDRLPVGQSNSNYVAGSYDRLSLYALG